MPRACVYCSIEKHRIYTHLVDINDRQVKNKMYLASGGPTLFCEIRCRSERNLNERGQGTSASAPSWIRQ